MRDSDNSGSVVMSVVCLHQELFRCHCGPVCSYLSSSASSASLSIFTIINFISQLIGQPTGQTGIWLIGDNDSEK